MPLPTELSQSLRAIAQELEAIAMSVRDDVDGATDAVRALDHVAGETAELATALTFATAEIDRAIADHAAVLAATIAGADHSLGVVNDLVEAANGIVTLSGAIGEIAGRSRMLALNARIEAARAGAESFGFHTVANEVGELARSTLAATGDIQGSTGEIMAGAAKTRSAFEAVNDFVARDRALLDSIIQAADRQRDIAANVAVLTDRTRSRIDDSAARIGRLGSSAAAVGAMIHQLVLLADQVEATA